MVTRNPALLDTGEEAVFGALSKEEVTVQISVLIVLKSY
jgi:hypothetical protein